ncbi:MAG TPA: hypothetical protein VLC09_17390 [Polyangiaceae bacterium]|nr:hypothetical protein [Polyangiaceae bacterium]
MLRVPRFLLCLAVLAWATTASAQRVVVARPTSDDATLFEAFGRLRAELELQGFEVTVVGEVGMSLDPDALEREAQAQDAFAAVALERHPGVAAAEIRIVDRVTGKTTTRRLAIDTSGDGPTLLAIRAVDMLRASLMEFASERPPPDVVGVRPEPPPPEVVRFAREPRRFSISVGALALYQPELGPAFGAALGFHYRPVQSVVLGFELGGPAFGGRYEASGGSADVRQEFALFEASYRIGGGSDSPFEFGPLLGVGVAHHSATGRVEPPLVAQTADGWSLMLDAGLALELHFNDTLSLGARLAGSAFVPQPVVAVNAERSPPLTFQALGSLGLGVSF